MTTITPLRNPLSNHLMKRSLAMGISAALACAAHGADSVSTGKEALRKRLLEVEQVVPKEKRPLRPLTDYANLTYKRQWNQLWDNTARAKVKEPIAVSGTVWSDAIDQSMREQNGIYIPEMKEILYLDRSIVVRSGSHIIVHPKTELRMITDQLEFALIRNQGIVSGQEGPVKLCKGADRDILIEGGIWGDSKNSGHGPQGFREGKFGLMLGSQGCFVLSNVENVTVRGVTFRDYSSFGIQIGNARNFLIEDVCVDNTKDGVHLEGPSEFGIIRTIHGPRAGDDAVALNAWDWRTSSLTFGHITDMLVDGSDVEDGACAIRILPGVKIYPDGTREDCRVERCIFSNLRNIHTVKIYDQPNVRDVEGDYSGDISTVSDIYFENIHLIPLHIAGYYDKGKNAVFELCAHADGLYLDNIRMDFEPGRPNAEYLMTVGPKTRVTGKPFQTGATQEIFNPKASPVAKNIVVREIYTRPEGNTGEYKKHGNPEKLVTATAIPGGGKGSIVGSVKTGDVP